MSDRSTRLTSPARSTAVADVAAVCAALADPTRLRILALLSGDEVCVCDIHGSLQIPQPTASRHLASLRKAGLVERRRDGLWMHYRMSPQLPAHVRHAVAAVLHAVGHCPEPAVDARQLAGTTGRTRLAPPTAVAGCCAAPRARARQARTDA